ncbi:hypothetical protein B0T24DRAFT_503452, partial [Lasiosphaeria ovina]
QYEAAGNAQTVIERMLDDIVKQATAKGASYMTKRNAVETMRKIFKEVLLASDAIGHEVRNGCHGWAAKMVCILATVDEHEMELLAAEGGGTWLLKFRELVSIAKSFDMLDELQEAQVMIEDGLEIPSDEDDDEVEY